MKKGIEKIVNSAREASFHECQIAYLENDQRTIAVAKTIYSYFRMCNITGKSTPEESVSEAEYVFSIYKPENEPKHRAGSDNPILDMLLPCLWTYRSCCMNNELTRDQKKTVANMHISKNSEGPGMNRKTFYNLTELMSMGAPKSNITALVKYSDFISSHERYYRLKENQRIMALKDIRDENGILAYMAKNQIKEPNDSSTLFKILQSGIVPERINDFVQDGVFQKKEFEQYVNPLLTIVQDKYLAGEQNVHINNYREDILLKLHEAAPEQSITINEPYYDMHIIEYEGVITVRFKGYKSSYITEKGNVYAAKISSEKEIVIFGMGAYYEKIKNKLIPLRIKTLHWLYDTFPQFQEFMEDLLDQEKKKNQFAKDIRNLIMDQHSIFVPWTLNGLLECYSFKDFFHKNYKKTKELKINPNKHDPVLVYLLIKSIGQAHPASTRVVLSNGLNPNVFETLYDPRLKTESAYLFACFKAECRKRNTEKTFIEEGDSIMQLFVDYLIMCRSAKEKVILTKTSYKKVKEIHDQISNKSYMKKTPKVTIPKDTKFKRLRQMLPDNFEWIKTRKRLIAETVEQHHCVWSYADRINKDICAIYSFIFEPEQKRYTIEFTMRNGNYYIAQMQSECDKGRSNESYNYVKQFL